MNITYSGGQISLESMPKEMTMNSRERVLTALAHREPDRVPFDLGGTVVTGINRLPYEGLRRALDLPHRDTALVDILQQIARIHDYLLDRL